jgi:hypothetical protein
MSLKFYLKGLATATATAAHSHVCVHSAFRKIKHIAFIIHVLSN